jgi:hypothetical protein
MNAAVSALVKRMGNRLVADEPIIPWSSPVASFGDPEAAIIATVGLNPSNREFVDERGRELRQASRRFHTLKSLQLRCWSEATDTHIGMIERSCREYFWGNPYDLWFKKLDRLLLPSSATFYGLTANACHLDLIPFATSRKWTELTASERSDLLEAAGDTLGILVKNSAIRVLILNGSSVVDQFERYTGVELDQREMRGWSLPRRSTADVKGIAYRGCISEISGVSLTRELLVLGFNHNIQSSFGVTSEVMSAIGRWIALNAKSTLS